MDIRKDELVIGHFYHIFNRSISKYIIFNDEDDFNRFYELLSLYRFIDFNYKYSIFKQLQVFNQKAIIGSLTKQNNVFVEIVAYCIMPTHIHLILKQNVDDGISAFISKVLNSYTRYFNVKHHRIGPLWEGHFKNVLVKDDEQILHLTRYIHLNPTSAKLVEKVEDWNFSSYIDYIDSEKTNGTFCSFENLFDFTPAQYRKFVNDRKSYQQELSLIKNILIDDYSG